MRKVSLLAGLALFALNNAQAQEMIPRLLGSPTVSASLFPTQPRQSFTQVPVHSTWQFIGCVHSSHDCHHAAHENGFSDYTVRHDHSTCHHGPSYACYAR